MSVTEDVLNVARYVLPPFLGAVIGYVTNAVAIRMLFRPLTEKRVLGIRVPLTPGIIPRRRHQLSESIAQMVSTKLLTPETVDARLRSPEFIASLRASVSGFTSDLLEGRISGTTPFAADMAEVFGSLAEGFVRSNRFGELAAHVVPRITEAAGAVRVTDLTPTADSVTEIVRRALQSAAGEEKRSAAVAAVRRWVEGHLESDTRMSDLVGELDGDRVSRFLAKVYDPAYAFLMRWLERPDVRADLAERGRELVKTILTRLNLVQRFLVSAAQYDRSLNEKMPVIVTDIVESIREAGGSTRNRSRIISAARHQIGELSHHGVADLAGRFRLDLPAAAESATNMIMDFLVRPDVQDRIAGAAWSFVERRGDATVEQLLHDGLSLTRAEVDRMLLDAVGRWSDAPGSGVQVRQAVGSFVERQLSASVPLENLVNLEAGRKAALDRFLSGKAAELIQERVPSLLQGLDIHGMVVQKIDGLDVESVEKLLLMVIAKHLKWINLFGAVLGALIGGLQVALNLLG